MDGDGAGAVSLPAKAGTDGTARMAGTDATVMLIGLAGIPEVQRDDDLAVLIAEAAHRVGGLREGDIVVVSSKVVSKALGLWADSRDRDSAVRGQTVRVVAERLAGDRVTQIVESAAGPVMAAAGVDASNTGAREEVLLLPAKPDAEAQALREALRERCGLERLGVIVSDTAGRPWRFGQTDFALGAAGVDVVDDLRGGVDADGRPLAVTTRAVADELAAAADLVKGKADAVPVAVVRGTPWAGADVGPGARALVRTGREDWFDHGRAEAVRAALGTAPGTPEAQEAGIASVGPEPVRVRLGRAVAVALRGMESVGADVGAADVRLSAESPLALGRAMARLEVALWGEGLVGRPAETGLGEELDAEVTVTERGP
jgi:coenzyme F420-0:L-glutamate ligase/coenzyme F420-1:gamma-L-glutamate ligase